MKRLSKHEILELNRPKVREVEIEEWEGSILIRSLKTKAVLELQKFIENGKPNQEYFYHLISLSVVDDNFEPVFTPKEVEDIDAMVLNKLIMAIFEMNSMNKEAVSQAKEELKKILRENSSSD